MEGIWIYQTGQQRLASSICRTQLKGVVGTSWNVIVAISGLWLPLQGGLMTQDQLSLRARCTDQEGEAYEYTE
jgi:hypothetical protein